MERVHCNSKKLHGLPITLGDDGNRGEIRYNFDKFHGFPVTHFGDDDIEEAGRGRLHGDFIEPQLDTCIHSYTDNGDENASKTLTVVSTNNPEIKNIEADSDLKAWRLIKL